MQNKIKNSPNVFLAKPVVLKLDGAASEIAAASQDFCDLAGLFEAIVASSEAGSLTRRLGEFGRHVCDDKESSYGLECERINDLVRGYLADLNAMEVT